MVGHHQINARIRHFFAGKYAVGGPKPFGPRSALFSDSRRREVEPLISLLQTIGKERQKTPAQVHSFWGEGAT